MTETTREDFDLWWAAASDYRRALLVAAENAVGYAGAEVRAASREVVVYGVGAPSAELVVLSDQAPTGFHVRWVQAPYTHVELAAELVRLMTAHQGLLVSGGARHDGTGLDLTTTDRELLEAEDPQGMLGSRYPVSIEYGESPVLC